MSLVPWPEETTHPLLSGAPRRGKWTYEEETYVAAIIQYFLSGVLPIPCGTTLRGYIAQLLYCDPMRVSKKLIPGTILVGVPIDPKIGRRAYIPCADTTPGLKEHQEAAMEHLIQLREAFMDSIEREELQEHTRPSGRPGDVRWHNPPTMYPRDNGTIPPVVHFRPLTNELVDDAESSRPTSLPSLNDLLRQNRLRVPSKSLMNTPPPSYPHWQSIQRHAGSPRQSHLMEPSDSNSQSRGSMKPPP